MKYVLTGLVLIISFVLIGALVGGVVLLLAGPHAGLLPQPVEIVIIILGWVVVFIGPLFITRAAWRRIAKRGAA